MKLIFKKLTNLKWQIRVKNKNKRFVEDSVNLILKSIFFKSGV